MKRSARMLVVVLGILGSTLSAEAGSPDLWQRASEPRLARDATVFRQAQQLVMQAYRFRSEAARQGPLLEQARALFGQIDGALSPDPRVRFLLGRVLQMLGDDAGCVRVLEPALASFPDDPNALDAYEALGVAYARLRMPREEIALYESVLVRDPYPDSRALVLINQAEAHMLLGDLASAQQRYRDAVQLDPSLGAAHWGMAVALDRDGDLHAALEQADAALQVDPQGAEIRGPGVFFVPSYERYWYEALEAMARVGQATDATGQLWWWEQAEERWGLYEQSAERADRWLATARAHRALCARQRDQLRRAVRPVR